MSIQAKALHTTGNSQKYRCRAECVSDAAELLNAMGKEFEAIGIKRESIKLPTGETLPVGDCEILLVVNGLTLEAVRDRIRTIEDGHVMLQTVATADQYEGKRDFNL